jgi:outer membrane protein TolC
VQAAEARVQRLDAALAVYDSGLRNLAAQNVDVVRQSYELGRATLLEVLNETRRLLDTEMTYTELLIEALQARIDLASAMGAIR